MLVEYTRYQLAPERQVALEEAYGKAQSALQASPHCLAYELTRCVEEPSCYILRIEWDSLEGHLQGFRTSAEFQPFLAAVRPFIPDIQEMRHYEATSVRGGKGKVAETPARAPEEGEP
jgi:heme-degrading monooxygenase HmoA